MSEILYVEGDDVLRGLYAGCLREAGFTVREVRRAEEGLDAIRCTRPDLVLLDVAMPAGAMCGSELLARLREEPAPVPIPTVVFSGLGNILNPEFLRALHVAAVVPKPSRVGHVVGVVAEVLATDARRAVV